MKKNEKLLPFTVKMHKQHPVWRIRTRDGKAARIVCTDMKAPYPVIALVSLKRGSTDVKEVIMYFTPKGENDKTFANDIFIVVPPSQMAHDPDTAADKEAEDCLSLVSEKVDVKQLKELFKRCFKMGADWISNTLLDDNKNKLS